MFQYLSLASLLFCGIPSEALEGITLPALAYEEIQSDIDPHSAMVWEWSTSANCRNFEIKPSFKEALLNGGYYHECLRAEIIHKLEPDNRGNLSENFDIRAVIYTEHDRVMQYVTFRRYGSMVFDPHSDREPKCIEVDSANGT